MNHSTANTQRKRINHQEPSPLSTTTASLLTSKASNVASKLIGVSGLVLASQALYVGVTTPRLPPPKNSGRDFKQDGLVISAVDETLEGSNVEEKVVVEDGKECKEMDIQDEERTRTRTTNRKDDEFRLVLVGDSPVEGIGNNEHHEAMGGQTALAFSKLLQRPVRYWSYGKSGLTAEGIRREMVPLLQGVVNNYDDEEEDGDYGGGDGGGIDAVIISCGVNNVLRGSSATSFGREVDDLLQSVLDCCQNSKRSSSASILLMELIDFQFLPFLPWPFRQVCSWRSQALKKEMEYKLLLHQKEQRQNRKSDMKLEMAYMPPILQMLENRHTHPLFEDLSPEEKESLQWEDFFADDNFHPASHGNTFVGKIFAETYRELNDLK